MKRYSYLLDLQCPVCQAVFDPGVPQRFCETCRSPILARYDLQAAAQQVDREEIGRRERGMWRWHELLPLVDEKNQMSLGEGDAPLLELKRLAEQMGSTELVCKR